MNTPPFFFFFFSKRIIRKIVLGPYNSFQGIVIMGFEKLILSTDVDVVVVAKNFGYVFNIYLNYLSLHKSMFIFLIY
jgi:hypothetical protein